MNHRARRYRPHYARDRVHKLQAGRRAYEGLLAALASDVITLDPHDQEHIRARCSDQLRRLESRIRQLGVPRRVY